MTFALTALGPVYAESLPGPGKSWIEMSEQERVVCMVKAMERGINIGRLFNLEQDPEAQTTPSRRKFRVNSVKKYLKNDRPSF